MTSVIGAGDTRDAQFFIGYFAKEGLLDRSGVGSGWRITGKGYRRADELSVQYPVSSDGFVAMWLKDDLREAYDDGLAKGISDAGYKPILITRHEHTNKIDDEIIAAIRRARFVVVDFTGQRQNVYYEAGFARGLGLRVIWTCRKDHIRKLHFDIRQYNCIDWQTPSELAERLQSRIEAVLGDGPNKLA